MAINNNLLYNAALSGFIEGVMSGRQINGPYTALVPAVVAAAA